MYKQQKKITVKVTRLTVAYNGSAGMETLYYEYIGAHLTEAQARKFIHDFYGDGYFVTKLDYENNTIPLDIEKIYKEYKESKEHE